MNIREAYFKNFKSLNDCNINMRNLTLLTGINSSGKSSFIQGLLLILQNIKEVENMINIMDLKESEQILKLYNHYLGKINLNGEYVNLGTGKDILYENAEDDSITFHIKSELGETKFFLKTQENLENDVIPLGDSTYVSRSFIGKNSNIQYLSTERIGVLPVYEYKKSFVQNNNLGNRGEYTVHYLAENKNSSIAIKTLKHNEAKSYHLLENVGKWLSMISKGIDIKAEIIGDVKLAKLTYTYDGAKKDYLPKDVGYGITYVLPIIVALLKAKSGDIVIIENPETHLHPSGQVAVAKLCSLAAEEGIQIIIESHSDHFLNGLRVSIKEGILKSTNAIVHYFSKDLDEAHSKIVEISIDEEGKIAKWPEGFFDEMDIQLEKLW